MFDWLTGIVGEDAAPIATYFLIFLVLLIGFFVLRWMLRLLRGGTFIHGGHGRKQRLAIVDATPVDNRRRLVLLRRDNVEHLVLIGGMNDLVVERDIEVQSASNVEPAPSAPAARKQQDKPDHMSKPSESAPAPMPKSKKIVEGPKPEPALKKPDLEQPFESKTPSIQPTKAPLKTKLGAAAPVAAASVAAVSEKPSPNEAIKETVVMDEPVLADAGTIKEPMIGRFSAYAENELDAPEPKIDMPEPVDSVDESNEVAFEDFMPISAPSPLADPLSEPTLESESQVEEDDTDLEDEMEELLNKLTKPSQL